MSSQEHKLLFYVFGQYLQVVKAATKKKKGSSAARNVLLQSQIT